MKYYLLFLLSIIFYSADAQKDNLNYSVINIPEELFIDSHSIVRESKSTFEIRPNESSLLKVKSVVTILNTQGEINNTLKINYDHLNSINSFSGYLYDKNGKYVRKLKKYDITDKSAIPDFSMYEDSRVKVANLKHSVYPYTVEYQYEISSSDLLHFPYWKPVSSSNMAVEFSSFEVIAPREKLFRFKEFNINPVQRTMKDNREIYTWEIKNYRAYEKEPLMFNDNSVFPMLHLAPNDFNYGDKTGNSQTWKTLGDFFYQLNEDRNKIPAELINEINQLTTGVESDKEKVKIVYDYLQGHTRYVSVQLGLGSLQTLTPQFVYENGYGDCKALCNFTQSILQSLDIPSLYTLVNAGVDMNDIELDFPSDQFNHVILCIPNKGDTIWLECTDPTLPLGYLGGHTMNRHVLFVTDEGGKIGRTPGYVINENVKSTNASLRLFENGSAESTLQITYQGLFFEEVAHLLTAPEVDKRKHFYNSFDLVDFELESVDFSQVSDVDAQLTESIDLTIPRFSNLDVGSIYFQPNAFNHQKKIDRHIKERLFSFEFRYPVYEIDSIEYQFPKNHKIENWPEFDTINSDFGSYSLTVQPIENGLLLVRNLRINEGVFKNEQYQNYINFINKIATTDKLRLLLTKQEQ